MPPSAVIRRRRAVGRDGSGPSPMDDIMRAATELFSRKGFHAATTQELADAVGLVKGTLYYHIGNKEKLLYRIHQQVTEDGIRRWSLLVTEDRPAASVIRDMIVEHCRVMDLNRDAIAVFSNEMRYLGPALRRRVIARRDVYHDLLERTIERGVERGEFSTTSSRLASLTILGMLNGMYRWYQSGGRLGPEEIGDLYSEIVLSGLRA